MKTLKPWLVIFLVFVAGVAAGVVVTRAVVRHFVHQAILNPDRVRDLVEKKMTANLRLDAGQRQKVHRILVDTQRDLQALRKEFTPRFAGITARAEAEVAAVLTPEQRERFNQFREENRRLWQPRE